jgi:hypothetical protein
MRTRKNVPLNSEGGVDYSVKLVSLCGSCSKHRSLYPQVALNDMSSPTMVLYIVLAYSSARPESSLAPIAVRASRICRNVSTK